jgi:plasmid maintenance system antidote protein VapI
MNLQRDYDLWKAYKKLEKKESASRGSSRDNTDGI